jgi:DNA-binding response OmpR family regulator
VAALLRRVERAEQLVRESADRPPAVVTLGGLRLDAGARRTWLGDEEVHLTPTEFDLLCTLASAPGQVLTRERLLAEVWGWDGGAGATRTVDSHVKALRAKIGADRVRTVHGVGYALEAV